MTLDLDPFIGLADNGAAFARTVFDVHGEAGQGWLSALPALLIDYARRWSIRLLPPFALSYHYVAPAIRADGSPAVLKAGLPTPARSCEILALQLCNGNGMARVLESDTEEGVLLLERLVPGTTLASLEDDAQATLIAAQVMRQVWQPLPADHPFPSVSKWAMGLERLRQTYHGGTGPLPANLVDQAERLFDELLASRRRAGAPARRPASFQHPIRSARAVARDRPPRRGRRTGLRGGRVAAQPVRPAPASDRARSHPSPAG